MTIGVPVVTGLPRLYQQCTNSVPVVKNSQKTVKTAKMAIGVPIVTCLHKVRRIHNVRVRVRRPRPSPCRPNTQSPRALPIIRLIHGITINESGFEANEHSSLICVDEGNCSRRLLNMPTFKKIRP